MANGRLRALGAASAVVAPLALGACAIPGFDEILDRLTPESESSAAPSETETAQLLRLADATLDGAAPTSLQFYRQAHAMAPGDVLPLVGMGAAYAALGRDVDAVQAYREALERDPANAEALRGLGAALIPVGDAPEALAAYDRMIAAAPHDHRGHNGRGIVLDMLGRHHEAQASYRAGLSMAPRNEALNNNLGLSLSLDGEHQAAIERLKALASTPQASAQTRQNLALALALAGDLDRADSVGSLDLGPEAVAGNRAFFTALNRSRRIAAAQIDAASPAETAPVTPVDVAPWTLSPAAGAPGDVTDAAPPDAAAAPALRGLTHALESVARRPPAGPRPGGDIGASPAPQLAGPWPLALPVRYRTRAESPETVADAAAELAGIAPAAGNPGFFVHLATTDSKSAARLEWETLRNRFPVLFAGLAPTITTVDRGGLKGLRYLLRTSPPIGEDAAQLLCSSLKNQSAACHPIRRRPMLDFTFLSLPALSFRF